MTKKFKPVHPGQSVRSSMMLSSCLWRNGEGGDTLESKDLLADLCSHRERIRARLPSRVPGCSTIRPAVSTWPSAKQISQPGAMM